MASVILETPPTSNLFLQMVTWPHRQLRQARLLERRANEKSLNVSQCPPDIIFLWSQLRRPALMVTKLLKLSAKEASCQISSVTMRKHLTVSDDTLTIIPTEYNANIKIAAYQKGKKLKILLCHNYSGIYMASVQTRNKMCAFVGLHH